MTRLVRAASIFRWFLVLGSFALATSSVVLYGIPHTHEAAEDARYYCPMHPQIRSHDPGECPICHMRLEPIPEERTRRSGAIPSTDAGTPAIAPPTGLAPIELSLARQQQFGIETVTVGRQSLDLERRYPAVLEAPEGATAELRSRVPAFVERVAIDRTGVAVRRGRPLVWLFSPDAARLGDELALARSLETGGDTRLADATRTSLERAGIDPSSATSDDASRRGRFALTAPRSGIVTRFEAPVGTYVSPDVVLFEITDLGRLFAVASVPDIERAAIAPGSRARFELPDGSSRDAVFDGPEPTIDAATRIARLRFVVENPETDLLPGGIGVLVVASTRADVLVVPRDAVVDTGDARYVFVDRGNGVFEPRSVEVGSADGDRIVVTRGLAPGEKVVTRGGFLIDSESRLTGAVRRVSNDAGGPGAAR